MARTTHNCILDVIKNDFGKVDEAMFQGVEMLCELIFYLLFIEKSNFGEVV
jgi:hypothetical protein